MLYSARSLHTLGLSRCIQAHNYQACCIAMSCTVLVPVALDNLACTSSSLLLHEHHLSTSPAAMAHARMRPAVPPSCFGDESRCSPGVLPLSGENADAALGVT